MSKSAFIDQAALEWAIRCFGPLHCGDKRTRAMRFLEEAAELAQACGVNAEEAAAIIEMVDNRKKGEIFKEIGQVMLTLAVLERATGTDRQLAYETEVCSVLAGLPEAFRQRNESKVAEIDRRVARMRDDAARGAER